MAYLTRHITPAADPATKDDPDPATGKNAHYHTVLGTAPDSLSDASSRTDVMNELSLVTHARRHRIWRLLNRKRSVYSKGGPNESSLCFHLTHADLGKLMQIVSERVLACLRKHAANKDVDGAEQSFRNIAAAYAQLYSPAGY